MSIRATMNGSARGSGFLIAPHDGARFPVPLALQAEDGDAFVATLEVAPGGADVVIEPSTVQIGVKETTVTVAARSASRKANDTVIRILRDGALQESLNITAIEKARLVFDGRFEVRFATNSDPYNHPRGGGIGWMWSLEGEPDFVPADSVPDRIEKAVGRVILFQEPGVARPHVPPIGVFVRSIVGQVGDVEVEFLKGDPVIGMPVNLGANSYFASNFPVSEEDRLAGRLPEEQHSDGFQPIGNFEFHVGDALSGGSEVGPHVPGTTLSDNPRDPDFRPRASGLVALSTEETAAYPFPTLSEFELARLDALLPDFVALKNGGQTESLEFRNLRTRVGHLLGRIDPQRRQQLLTEHADVALRQLSGSAGFAWGNREIYRGKINANYRTNEKYSGIIDYFSKFQLLEFLCVFFNFHTDEARAHCYGSVDPTAPPRTLDRDAAEGVIA